MWERRRVALEVTALYVGNGVEDMAVNDRVGEQIGLRKQELFARSFESPGLTISVEAGDI